MLIITGSDNNYVPGVMVLIASAAYHNPQARFAVLDMGITAENRARIDALGEYLGVEIQRKEVKCDLFSNLKVKRKHLNRSTYLRLIIPQLFPEEKQVIYMDCDMVVVDQLTALEDLPFKDELIAAVPCPSPDLEEIADTGHHYGSYINAGLLVMNLSLWRDEKIAEKCIDLLSNPDHHLMSEDQSAVNIIARHRTMLLPAKFNVYSDPSAYEKKVPLPEKAAVIHYVVSRKPWNCPANLEKIWSLHAEKIKHLMADRKKTTLRRKFSRINMERKMLLGVLLRNPKYLKRREIMKKMNQRYWENYRLSLETRP